MLRPFRKHSYWDAQANNWAFDYNSYYATYGYPQQRQGGPSSSAYGSYAGPSTSQYGAPAYNDPGLAYATAGSAAAAAAQGSHSSHTAGAEGTDSKPKKALPGAKDAEGKPLAGSLQRGEHRTTVLREGVNGVYEDPTLLEWDPSHKRLFVGDLGNDVTDQMLSQAFEKYASFSKARVVRRKHDHKSKGYGFVAFANPEDYLKAWKEMNGRYIGSRPCRLKAAEVNVEAKKIGYRQDKMLANTVKHEEFKAKYKMGGAIGGTLRRHGVGKAWASK